MALKRLDEEFELKPGTQLLPYMKRLLPSLEGRFQELETAQDLLGAVTEDIRAAALLRMNEILIPATKDIIAVTKLGFLLAPVSAQYTLVMGYMTMNVDEGAQRTSFTPSPYVIVEDIANYQNYGIARVGSYTQSDGLIELYVTAIHGNPGPHQWMIASTPGMADSVQLYHDAVGPMHDTVVADTAEVVTKHAEIMQVAQDLEESGIDLFNYVRKDGSTPFTAAQTGVHPASGSNDTQFATTAWSRTRMQEYVGQAMQRTGDTMTGPLTLFGPPYMPLHAATKAYVDSIIGAGGVVNGSLTINAVNPSLRLKPTGPQQYRMIESLASSGAQRWVLAIADPITETGGNAGSNFSLTRYDDSGTYLDVPLQISRQTGAMSTKAIVTAGPHTITSGNLDVNLGDIGTYRANNANTGMLFLNQSRSAYHHYDGTTHQLVGGGLNTNGGAISCGAINSVGPFSTNGYLTTTWGLTSNGAATINGPITINGDIVIQSTANYIRFNDTDWGNMYIHHNGELIGYLNNGGGWINYTTNAGHIWTAQYGWIHDYVNNTAYNHAVNQANAYVQARVSNGRLVYAGDFGFGWNSTWTEPGNTVCTGLYSWYAGGQYIILYMRSRYIQFLTTGWFTIGFA